MYIYHINNCCHRDSLSFVSRAYKWMGRLYMDTGDLTRAIIHYKMYILEISLINIHACILLIGYNLLSRAQ